MRRTDVYCAGGRDTKEALEKGRRIGRKDTNALVSMLLQEICQSTRAVCRLFVVAAEDASIRRDVVDSFCL